MKKQLVVTAAQMAALLNARLAHHLGGCGTMTRLIVPATLSAQRDFEYTGQLIEYWGEHRSLSTRPYHQPPLDSRQPLKLVEPCLIGLGVYAADAVRAHWTTGEECTLPGMKRCPAAQVRYSLCLHPTLTLKRLGALTEEDALKYGARELAGGWTFQDTARTSHPAALMALKAHWDVLHPSAPWDDQAYVWLADIERLVPHLNADQLARELLDLNDLAQSHAQAAQRLELQLRPHAEARHEAQQYAERLMTIHDHPHLQVPGGTFCVYDTFRPAAERPEH